ncbi:MAG: hypothetical protein LBS61_02705 [Endomicrobium sp.]|jgi:hypothetical protein|nr:hypothetical protein [Endomicrobium sp.]
MNELVVTFYNVGHGNCTHITTPKGWHILVDVGSSEECSISQYLRKSGVESIEMLHITHTHKDHLYDLPTLKEIGLSPRVFSRDKRAFPVTHLYDASQKSKLGEKSFLPSHPPQCQDEKIQQAANDFISLFSLMAIGVIYMIGLIINRVSSIIIEDFLIKWKPLDERDYGDFNNARKENPFLYTLSREYALSRGNLALWLIITVISIISLITNTKTSFSFCQILLFIMLSSFVTYVFFRSMRKFSQKINVIVKNFKQSNKGIKPISAKQ